jgi:hypothetical protein
MVFINRESDSALLVDHLLYIYIARHIAGTITPLWRSPQSIQVDSGITDSYVPFISTSLLS